jgi:hypothetical protein
MLLTTGGLLDCDMNAFESRILLEDAHIHCKNEQEPHPYDLMLEKLSKRTR